MGVNVSTVIVGLGFIKVGEYGMILTPQTRKTLTPGIWDGYLLPLKSAMVQVVPCSQCWRVWHESNLGIRFLEPNILAPKP